MLECEPHRVEELPFQPQLARTAVDRVARDRQVDRRQVNADLMCPPGFQADIEQCVLRKKLDEGEVRDRIVRRRKLERRYLALVCGHPRSRRGTIEAPIGRDRHDPTRQSLDTATPRDAVTHFEVVELLPRHALLEVRLETGRTHQIRVHLAAIDLPVAGDPVYGRPGELGLERQFLHAARLAFPHPMTGEQVETESPLPPDLEAALARARA